MTCCRDFACQTDQGIQKRLHNLLIQSSIQNYVQAMACKTMSIRRLSFYAPIKTSLPQSLVNTGLSNRDFRPKYTRLSHLTVRHYGNKSVGVPHRTRSDTRQTLTRRWNPTLAEADTAPKQPPILGSDVVFRRW